MKLATKNIQVTVQEETAFIESINVNTYSLECLRASLISSFPSKCQPDVIYRITYRKYGLDINIGEQSQLRSALRGKYRTLFLTVHIPSSAVRESENALLLRRVTALEIQLAKVEAKLESFRMTSMFSPTRQQHLPPHGFNLGFGASAGKVNSSRSPSNQVPVPEQVIPTSQIKTIHPSFFKTYGTTYPRKMACPTDANKY